MPFRMTPQRGHDGPAACYSGGADRDPGYGRMLAVGGARQPRSLGNGRLVFVSVEIAIMAPQAESPDKTEWLLHTIR